MIQRRPSPINLIWEDAFVRFSESLIALSVKHTQHHPNSSREKNQLRRFDIQDIQSYSIKCTRGLKVTHANNFLLFYRSESGLLEICLDGTHDVGHDEGFMI